MPTLLEILQRTTAYLAGKGIASAKLNAELLIAHVMKLRRLDIYLQFDRPLDSAQLDALRPLVARRGKREPLEYIIGSRPFVGLDLLCAPSALIPRSETEELVELLEQHFAAPPASTTSSAPARVLDLGTGTGALALALAQLWPQAEVTAVDFSEETLALARSNAERNALAERVRFVRSDWFAALAGQAGAAAASATALERFDLIVSNPPYLTQQEWEAADPEVKDYEPYHALVAAQDGLADLQKILLQAPAFLNPGGLLALETGIAQHAALAELAAQSGAYAATYSHTDSDSRPRFFLAVAK